MEQTTNTVTFTLDPAGTEAVSPYIFGHNLEHTRAAMNGGLSAQLLKNRKFAGKGSANGGVAAHWFGIGEKVLFQLTGNELFQSFSPVYTRHTGCEKMLRRGELQAQDVQNLEDRDGGIGQSGIFLAAGRRYQLRVVTMTDAPRPLDLSLTDPNGETVYAQACVSLVPGDWQISEFTLIPSQGDASGCLRATFRGPGRVIFGAVSLLPEENFHGMRRDVVERLKEVGPSLLRWPGGNFSGEYRWMDGLLPVDERGPLQAATEIETQPFSDGYDYHEISTDDFLALCREVGAEPLLTINFSWNTPQESAAWVEYCNGGPETEYGRIRAERGHPEPYGVKYWALGNEIGYRHMEGISEAAAYAELGAEHAAAMLAVSPDLQILSSGPYPSDEWAAQSAAALRPLAPYVSLHHYCSPDLDYSTPEKTRETYRRVTESTAEVRQLASEMRASLDAAAPGLHISFDEWNQWYAWQRPSCVAEGIFTAKMLHLFLEMSVPLDIPICCFFQPVGEGAVLIRPESSELTADGQAFALMKAHCGGRLCRIEGDGGGCVAATRKDGEMTLTLINDGYDGARTFRFAAPGRVAGTRLLSSEDVRPHSRFTEGELRYGLEDGVMETSLPPHSTALLRFALDA